MAAGRGRNGHDAGGAEEAMRNACKEAVLDLMRQDENVMFLTADGHDFISQIPAGHECQFVDYGIAESNMIASATGLAACGKRPFLFAVTNFMAMRGVEFIRDMVCLPKYPIVFIGFFAGLARGSWGATHHGTEDLAILRTLPDLTVVTPATPREAKAAVLWAYRQHEAVYIRIEAGHEQEYLPEDYAFEAGKGTILHDGKDITVVVTGSILSEAMSAAKNFEQEGISLRVIDLPTVRPVDVRMICEAADETRGIVTLEEQTVYGGLGSAVAEVLAEHQKSVSFRRLGLADFAKGCGNQSEMREQNGIGKDVLCEAIHTLLKG